MTAQIVSLAAYCAIAGKIGMSSGSHIKRARLVPDRRKQPRLGKLRAERRDEPRYCVEARCNPGIILGNGKVNLVNVSSNGLMIRADLPARPGTRMLMTPIGCRPVSARLVWKRDGLAGLEAPLVSVELHLL